MKWFFTFLSVFFIFKGSLAFSGECQRLFQELSTNLDYENMQKFVLGKNIIELIKLLQDLPDKESQSIKEFPIDIQKFNGDFYRKILSSIQNQAYGSGGLTEKQVDKMKEILFSEKYSDDIKKSVLFVISKNAEPESVSHFFLDTLDSLKSPDELLWFSHNLSMALSYLFDTKFSQFANKQDSLQSGFEIYTLSSSLKNRINNQLESEKLPEFRRSFLENFLKQNKKNKGKISEKKINQEDSQNEKIINTIINQDYSSRDVSFYNKRMTDLLDLLNRDVEDFLIYSTFVHVLSNFSRDKLEFHNFAKALLETISLTPEEEQIKNRVLKSFPFNRQEESQPGQVQALKELIDSKPGDLLLYTSLSQVLLYFINKNKMYKNARVSEENQKNEALPVLDDKERAFYTMENFYTIESKNNINPLTVLDQLMKADQDFVLSNMVLDNATNFQETEEFSPNKRNIELYKLAKAHLPNKSFSEDEIRLKKLINQVLTFNHSKSSYSDKLTAVFDLYKEEMDHDVLVSVVLEQALFDYKPAERDFFNEVKEIADGLSLNLNKENVIGLFNLLKNPEVNYIAPIQDRLLDVLFRAPDEFFKDLKYQMSRMGKNRFFEGYFIAHFKLDFQSLTKTKQQKDMSARDRWDFQTLTKKQKDMSARDLVFFEFFKSFYDFVNNPYEYNNQKIRNRFLSIFTAYYNKIDVKKVSQKQQSTEVQTD